MENINNITYGCLTENDIDDVLELQKLSYNENLLESKETFLSIINSYQEGCFYLRNNDKLLAYFITHPENINNLPPLLNNTYSTKENNMCSVQFKFVTNKFEFSQTLLGADQIYNKFDLQSTHIYYFHDLAVHPSARNLKIGSLLMYLAIKIPIINKFDKIALTAVQNADKYWEKFGFNIVNDNININSLVSYGDNAVVMISSISSMLNKLYSLGLPSLIFVYIIQLKNNKYYVIKSTELLDSLEINEFNSIEWLYYNPIINFKEYTEIRIFENDINEDTIVIELMQKYGINHVRGGSFKTLNISIDNTYKLFNSITKELNKCFLCMQNHNVNMCKLKNKYHYQYLLMLYEIFPN